MVAEILSGSLSTAEQIKIAIDKMVHHVGATGDFAKTPYAVWADQPGPAASIVAAAARELALECQRCSEALGAIAMRLGPVIDAEVEDTELDPDDVIAKIGDLVPVKTDVEPS